MAAKDALIALFEQARAENKWFYHGGMTGPLWFSPAELEAELAAGHFLWGALNWRLRDPAEHLHEIDMKRKALTDEWHDVNTRIRKG
jgi:hypothetical protein